MVVVMKRHTSSAKLKTIVDQRNIASLEVKTRRRTVVGMLHRQIDELMVYHSGQPERQRVLTLQMWRKIRFPCHGVAPGYTSQE